MHEHATLEESRTTLLVPHPGPAGDDDAESLRARWLEPEGDGTRRDAMLRRLAERRGAGHGEPLDLRGLPAIDADFEGLDLTGCDLSGADLSRANLVGAVLFRARLRGTTLFEADLTDAELSGADLTGANLRGAEAAGAGLGRCCLDDAVLLEANLAGATLTDATLVRADLRLATLARIRGRSMDLSQADLTRANLTDAELDGSRVRGAVFDGADLRRASLKLLDGYEQAHWIGVDVREIDFTGAHLCRRFILDQNYLAEFRSKSRANLWLYRAWWITSDCGRSFLRWALWTGVLVVIFAGLYTMADVDYGAHETVLSPFYFSVVTLTTLGFGDILPTSVGAQLIAMAEVTVGYMALGGLLSIFSNKMARRAE